MKNIVNYILFGKLPPMSAKKKTKYEQKILSLIYNEICIYLLK